MVLILLILLWKCISSNFEIIKYLCDCVKHFYPMDHGDMTDFWDNIWFYEVDLFYPLLIVQLSLYLISLYLYQTGRLTRVKHKMTYLQCSSGIQLLIFFGTIFSYMEEFPKITGQQLFLNLVSHIWSDQLGLMKFYSQGSVFNVCDI